MEFYKGEKQIKTLLRNVSHVLKGKAIAVTRCRKTR